MNAFERQARELAGKSQSPPAKLGRPGAKLGAARIATQAVSRRSFLGGLAAGSWILAARVDASPSIEHFRGEAGLSFEPDLFVAFEPDGTVRILAHRSEMGTGIRTALPMVVADELGASWDRVVIDQALGDARLGSQNTDGSRSIRRFFDRMRVAGATAREMLQQAAAARWGVSVDGLKTMDHKVRDPETGRELDFSELLEAAASLTVPSPETLQFRPASERRYIGKDVPLTDLNELVTGQATFGLDMRREGQLYAVVARSPVYAGSLKSVDDSAARSVPGVVDVIQIPPFQAPHAFQALGGVAVLAESTWAAMQGRRALVLEWEPGDHAVYDSDVLEQELRESARGEGKVWRDEGDVQAAFADAQASDVHEAEYYVPMLAHASMEPPCAVAEVFEGDDGLTCEAWAPVQNPQAAQDTLAAMFGLPAEDIRVHVTLLGGGFGRKSKPDFIAEAAFLSRQTQRPVQVTWTREDDIRHDFYHTPAAVHMRAVHDSQGRPQAWIQRSAAPTIASTFAPGAREPMPLEMGLGFTDLPYSIPNLRVESGAADAHVRIGWLRSVAHIYHAFGVCSFPDELAHKAGRDPLEHLLELLGEDRLVDMSGVEYPNHDEPLDRYPVDTARLRYVTERAAELAGWGKELPKGRGMGIATHRSFLSYCANVVEVEIDKQGNLTIPKVTVVLDAGTVVHPDRVVAQMEGAAVFGASLALFGEITAKGGAIQQSNFHDYPMARIYDAPREIKVELVQSDELPAGVGEVGVPPFPPALCNAIFAATGKRIRRLPLSQNDLSWS